MVIDDRIKANVMYGEMPLFIKNFFQASSGLTFLKTMLCTTKVFKVYVDHLFQEVNTDKQNVKPILKRVLQVNRSTRTFICAYYSTDNIE